MSPIVKTYSRKQPKKKILDSTFDRIIREYQSKKLKTQQSDVFESSSDREVNKSNSECMGATVQVPSQSSRGPEEHSAALCASSSLTCTSITEKITCRKVRKKGGGFVSKKKRRRECKKITFEQKLCISCSCANLSEIVNLGSNLMKPFTSSTPTATDFEKVLKFQKGGSCSVSPLRNVCKRRSSLSGTPKTSRLPNEIPSRCSFESMNSGGEVSSDKNGSEKEFTHTFPGCNSDRQLPDFSELFYGFPSVCSEGGLENSNASNVEKSDGRDSNASNVEKSDGRDSNASYVEKSEHIHDKDSNVEKSAEKCTDSSTFNDEKIDYRESNTSHVEVSDCRDGNTSNVGNSECLYGITSNVLKSDEKCRDSNTSDVEESEYLDDNTSNVEKSDEEWLDGNSFNVETMCIKLLGKGMLEAPCGNIGEGGDLMVKRTGAEEVADTSDLEMEDTSAVNSTDLSAKSGVLDEEESLLQTSDEETSGLSKDRDVSPKGNSPDTSSGKEDSSVECLRRIAKPSSSLSAMSRDSTFFSVDNSDREGSSDSEYSSESSKGSRRGSFESLKNLSRETMDHLGESLSVLKIQDEYEESICKSRKSKRLVEWECPLSPRRRAFPPKELFPLPENLEDSQEEVASPCDVGGRRSRTRASERASVDQKESSEEEVSSPMEVKPRRSRRSTRKTGGGRSQLNMVIEESDLESDLALAEEVDHIVLPTGKKFRRSLVVLRRLDEDMDTTCLHRGRNYDVLVENVISLQTSVRKSYLPDQSTDVRKSLAAKRRSLIGQSTVVSVTSPYLARLHRSVLSPTSPAALSRLSYSIADESQETFSAQDVVLRVCYQKEPTTFADVLYGEWEEGCRKLGEGVYGEVFLIPRAAARNVLKIIPIEGSFPVNGEPQNTYAEIANELFITSELSNLRQKDNFMTSGFSELVSAHVVKGRYPDTLIDLWRKFDLDRGSENDCPTMFGDEQLYLVLELANAGTDLESYSFSTAKQGLSIFKQVVCALAVAESCQEFEHRDLHWGNVLVTRTSDRTLPFLLNSTTYNIHTNGVKATIIDFTLSRMTVNGSCRLYKDLERDPEMFIGTGDLQFEVYRAMREDVGGQWEQFAPRTNVRWLHYLADKMVASVRYQRKTAKVHTDSIRLFQEILQWILSCHSALQVAHRIVRYK